MKRGWGQCEVAKPSTGSPSPTGNLCDHAPQLTQAHLEPAAAGEVQHARQGQLTAIFPRSMP